MWKKLKNWLYIKRLIYTTLYKTRNHDKDLELWWELSYAQYLTIPRVATQSMPEEWQQRFAKCLNELDEKIDWRPKEGRYYCYLRDAKGRFIKDPLANYRHRRLECKG